MLTVRRSWQVLAALALLGCVSSLFGPAERWLGVDIGAIGFQVFTLAMIGAVILACARPAEVFPDHWSLAESRGWVGLVFITLIVAAFARYLMLLTTLDPFPARIYEFPAGHLLWLLINLFIAWGIISGVLAYRGGPDEDERDLRMRFRADRIGDWALTLAVAACVAVLVGAPAERLAWWLQPLVVAHLLIGILILRTLIEHVALVTHYAIARQ